MTRFMSVAAVLGLVFATGCGGDPCEDAGDRITAKFEECGITVDSTGDGEDVECTDALEATSDCLASCTEAADCGALDASDLDAAADYGTCVADC